MAEMLRRIPDAIKRAGVDHAGAAGGCSAREVHLALPRNHALILLGACAVAALPIYGFVVSRAPRLAAPRAPRRLPELSLGRRPQVSHHVGASGSPETLYYSALVEEEIRCPSPS
jgi:hypothetical protein